MKNLLLSVLLFCSVFSIYSADKNEERKDLTVKERIEKKVITVKEWLQNRTYTDLIVMGSVVVGSVICIMSMKKNNTGVGNTTPVDDIDNSTEVVSEELLEEAVLENINDYLFDEADLPDVGVGNTTPVDKKNALFGENVNMNTTVSEEKQENKWEDILESSQKKVSEWCSEFSELFRKDRTTTEGVDDQELESWIEKYDQSGW